MKKTSKIISVLLAAALVFTAASSAFAAPAGEIVVTNPYENVDWDAVTAYKTALHSHTNASDGDQTLYESVSRHAEADFDIVAITDHGTVDRGWAEPAADKFIHTVLDIANRTEGELVGLGSSGSLADGTGYVYATAENGDDYLALADGRRILRVPFGIENNAVSVNAHVNSWFAEYRDNTVTVYEDAVRGAQKAGALCVINHPGEYTKARYELRSADAYNEAKPSYAYYINMYADLIDRYDACIGIDVNSKGDNRTRFERVLWDNLLTRFSAKGENVFGICSSDAHQLRVIDTGYVRALMPELTSAALRSALENGEFFGGSHCIGNPEELYDIADALLEFYGATPLYDSVLSAARAMTAKAEAIESGEADPDDSLGVVWESLDENGYATAADPAVTGVFADGGRITINTADALLVRFVSEGRLIATERADGGSVTLDLSDYRAELGDYVRAEVFGEGGVLYVQPFLLNAAEKTDVPVVKGVYINLGFLDFLLAELRNLAAIITRFFSGLFAGVC